MIRKRSFSRHWERSFTLYWIVWPALVVMGLLFPISAGVISISLSMAAPPIYGLLDLSYWFTFAAPRLAGDFALILAAIASYLYFLCKKFLSSVKWDSSRVSLWKCLTGRSSFSGWGRTSFFICNRFSLFEMLVVLPLPLYLRCLAIIEPATFDLFAL